MNTPARNVSRIGFVGTVLAILALMGVTFRLPTAQADMGDFRVTEGGAVYLGNPRLFSRPCVVLADSIYREIAEYREILEKGLTDKDVRYHFLMRKASERFTEAVKQMARELDHDLVAEVGACKAARREVAAPPERTSDVISRLR